MNQFWKTKNKLINNNMYLIKKNQNYINYNVYLKNYNTTQ